jgi:cellulose synthase/poly-beta-1,6-N-acetylglucosamine synthase-like glycosyltransferase
MPLAPESWVATAAFGLVAAIFAATAASKLFHQRWVIRLAPLEAPPDAAWATPVHVSVVIAARDEAAAIEGTVKALLAQQGVALEVIVVSDRSTDGTADVVRRLGGAEPRARVIEVTELPARWIGKCHACYTGAAAAAGDWILFTDADCRLAPDVIARALAAAARERADHVALTPAPIDPTLGAKAWYLVFGASITNWISAANRDLKDGHFGIGAFNMVRASTYRACGGYEALRLTILDDVRLSLLVRRAGGRSRIFLGADDVLCRWATSVGDAIRLTEKNYFAAIDFRTPVAVGGAIAIALLFGTPLAGLASGTWLGLACGLSPFLLSIPAARGAARVGWSPVIALLVPFFYPLPMVAMLRSAVLTLRQGGVRWRDTFYPTAMLRDGAVR